MVMDYVEGQTLAQYIRSTSQAGQFPSPLEIVHLFTSISKAIDYAHQHGMIYRDIKPANILLDKRNTTLNPMGEPVLTDFGIAKLIDASSSTMSGMWLGTPLYISPEQALGQPGNERSDLYSLGIILYEICTGVQPFRGEGATAIRQQHIYATPTAPLLINPRIPPALALVIMRSIAKAPADRFSSASAMTAAIADAFNFPVPTDLLPLSDDRPTYVHPHEPGAPPDSIAPDVSQPVPQGQGSLPTLPTLLMSDQPLSSSESGSDPAAMPLTNTPVGSRSSPAVQTPQVALPPYSGPALPATPLPPLYRPRRSLKWWQWLSIGVVILVVVTFFALFVKPSSSPPPAANSMVGSVIFLSSEQLNNQNSQGVDDEVQVNLHNIPNPAPGESYYAWLKSAPINVEGSWILLGTLQVNHGSAQLTSIYQDPQHANLLISASSFLVTEGASNSTQIAPSTDLSTWRYYSQPAVVTLTHLRHLLANSPELLLRNLSGGLGIWFWRNTGKLVEWADSARDDSPADTGFIYRQLIRILDYIDGAASVSMDVPANTPLYASQLDAQVALVGPAPHLEPAGSTYKGEVPPGYVYLIRIHLDAAVELPQATAEQRQLANQIDSSLSQVASNLEQARQDVKLLLPLIKGANTVTPQAQQLLNDLVANVQSASEGPTNLNLSQGGATGIYRNLQQMATFEVQPYTAQ